MTKVVLSQRDDSGYDDVPGKLYHFPKKKLLRPLEEAKGEQCLFYEPSRGEKGARKGREAYWAFGEVGSIFPDPDNSDRCFAEIRNFLPFNQTVPRQRADGHFWESALEKPDGSVNLGAMGWSVRRIPPDEFHQILNAGFARVIAEEANERGQNPSRELEEDQSDFERPLIERISRRPFRDRAFALQVREAYDRRCAVTGLRIINGGGRAEMEAAHIRPVEASGPDLVRNGLALSRTVHWMFDRGLISVDDNYKLLRADKLLPEGVDRLFHRSGYVTVPDDEKARPSPAFLRWHRENRFKESL